MSKNSDAMQEAKILVGNMVRYVELYEKGKIGSDVFEADLSAAQVVQLKQAFVSARTACIAALNKVTG